jgi:hypothetical protein
MIYYLKTFFKPDSYEQGFSLAIVGGRGGARLTHSHEHQYLYVLQSLSLWREILHDMFKLWFLAEQDLLSAENYYRLRNTGQARGTPVRAPCVARDPCCVRVCAQGLNRVQSAPLVGRAISGILHKWGASALRARRSPSPLQSAARGRLMDRLECGAPWRP